MNMIVLVLPEAPNVEVRALYVVPHTRNLRRSPLSLCSNTRLYGAYSVVPVAIVLEPRDVQYIYGSLRAMECIPSSLLHPLRVLSVPL